jgi:sulfur relay (sulfurtransferase) DsrF/TusC family protein
VEYIHRRSKQNSRTQKQESRTAHASLKKHRLILDEHISSVKKLQVPAAIQMMNKMVSYDLFILFGTNKCWVENRYREKKRKRKKEDRQVS